MDTLFMMTRIAVGLAFTVLAPVVCAVGAVAAAIWSSRVGNRLLTVTNPVAFARLEGEQHTCAALAVSAGLTACLLASMAPVVLSELGGAW